MTANPGQPIVWCVLHLAVRASLLDRFPFACPLLLIHVAMQLCVGGFRAAQAHPRRDVFDRQCGFSAQPGCAFNERQAAPGAMTPGPFAFCEEDRAYRTSRHPRASAKLA